MGKLSANQKKKVRRYFGVSAQDVHRQARRLGQTLKQHYAGLYTTMTEKRERTRTDKWVDATFYQYVEVRDHHKITPGNEVIEIDGVRYVRTRSSRRGYNFVIPERAAHDWSSTDIDTLMEVSSQYPAVSDLARMLDALSGGKVGSGSVHLKFVSSKGIKSPTSVVPPATKAKNRNGVRHAMFKQFTNDNKVIRKIRTPVHQDFKPTWREQYVEPEFAQEGMCMWNCILNEYKERWDSQYKKPLTYEHIAKIIGKEPGEACWDDFTPLFEKLKCPITMMNKEGEIEAKFVPDKKNTKLNKSLYIIRHDAHTYRVEDTRIKQSLAMRAAAEDHFDHISDKIREVQPAFEMNGVVADLDDLRRRVLECDAEKQVYIWKGGDLNVVFEQLWFDEGVQPNLNMFCDVITSLVIPFGSKDIVLRVPSEEPNEIPCIDGHSDEVYTRYEELMHEARLKLLNKKSKDGFLSKYSDDLIDVFKTGLGPPLVGLFGETKETEFVGLDQSKCYPFQLCQLKRIGVFSRFDDLQRYDGHRIEECTLYQFANGEARFGVGVSKKCGRPVSFIRPHKAKKNTLGGIIKKIMTDDVLPEHLKKSICNIVIGQTGKAKNKKSRYEVFENESEALRYVQRVHPFEEMLPGTARRFCNDRLWVVQDYAEGGLSEGFRVIQKMIYDKTRKHIEDTIDMLAEKGIKALGVKCDSVFVSVDDAEKLDYPEKYECSVWDSMGKLKKEKKKRGDMSVIKVVSRQPVQVSAAPQPTVHTLVNERDTTEANGILGKTTTEYHWVDASDERLASPTGEDEEDGPAEFQTVRNFNLTAEYPGSGKTYAAVEYAKSKTDNYIVACFSNAQAREFRKQEVPVPSTTVYKLCGARPTEEADAKLMRHNYDIVIIDELGMHGSTTRLMLSSYMKRNPKTQFLATEDLLQLEPIECPDWNPDNVGWYEMVSAKMFQHNLFLKEPKRFVDAQKVKKLKTELFDGKFLINEYAKKVSSYVELWSDKSLFVSYTNAKRHEVNEVIHKHLGYTEYYIRGLEYICKKKVSCGKHELHVSCVYTLIDYDEKTITIQDPLETEVMIIKRHYGDKKVDRLSKDILSLPYCKTCHSVQGSSVEGNVVLFETNHYCVSKNWLYVALTRAKDLDRVFYMPETEQRMASAYMKKKCLGYIDQDRKAGRIVQKGQHIWEEDILEMSAKQGHLCGRCHCEMNFVNEGTWCDWTVDRWDDSRGHEKGNCFLSHLSCNVGKVGDC